MTLDANTSAGFGGPPWHDQLAGWTLYLFATDDDETVLCVRALYKYTFLVDMQSAAMSHPYTDIIVVFIGYMNGHE